MIALQNRLAPVFAAALLAVSCSPTPEEQSQVDAVNASQSAEETADPAAAESGSAEAATDATGDGENTMQLAETGWRIVGQDGAVYTTFLDNDGTYRDLKNGEPFEQGKWERRADGELCYTPDAEDRAGECWTLETPDSDGTMRATSDSDLTIEARQVTYIAPAEE